MCPAAHFEHPPGRRRPLGGPGSGAMRAGWLLALLIASVLCWATPARSQSIELAQAAVSRADGAVTLDFSARLSLSRTVEEALQRGVPVYFVAEATLLRSRWYWRDERIARVTRGWRLAYQPLTNNWRVAQGGIGQSHATLAEALSAISAVSRWKLADVSQIDGDARHYVDFSYRLDTSQLPSPMQIGLTSQSDWVLRVGRTLRLDP
jgi:hypothetical protein